MKSTRHLNIGKGLIEHKFECKICDKKYKTNMGLWKHKKGCKEIKTEEIKEGSSKPLDINSMNYIIEKFTEINKNIIEDALKNNPTTTTTTNNTTNTNNNNNIFNIFLEEKCGDALNFSDVLEKLRKKLTISDSIDIISKTYFTKLLELIVSEIDTYPVKRRPLYYIKGMEENEIQVRENDIWNHEKDGKEYITKSCINDFEGHVSNFVVNNRKKIGDDATEDILFEINQFNLSASQRGDLVEQIKRCNDLNEGMIMGPFG